MLGRRDLEGEKQFAASSPETPTDPPSHLTRPATVRSHRSGRSDSFKALLLRKGSRIESSSRISAVERLRVVQAPTIQTPPPPSTPHQSKPGSPSRTVENTDILLSVNVPEPPTSLCTLSLMFGWRRQDNQLLLTSTSPSSFFIFSSSHVRPRSLTPPSSASRRFASRCRLFSAPMTAIFEGEEEEEEVLVEARGDSNLRQVEIS